MALRWVLIFTVVLAQEVHETFKLRIPRAFTPLSIEMRWKTRPDQDPGPGLSPVGRRLTGRRVTSQQASASSGPYLGHGDNEVSSFDLCRTSSWGEVTTLLITREGDFISL